MNDLGLKSKQWKTRTGKPKGGKSYDRNAIYTLIKNCVYLGEVFYTDRWHEGKHEAIIDHDLWDKVTELLQARRRRGKSTLNELSSKTLLPLTGRLFGADGQAMSPWLSSIYKNRRYAYYVLQRDITEGAGASGLPRLQAAQLNHQVWSVIRQYLAAPDCLIDHLPKALIDNADFDRPLVIAQLKKLEAAIDLLFPINKQPILLQLVERVTLHTDRLDLQISLDGLMDLVLELLSDTPDLIALYRQLYASEKSRGR